MPRTREPGAGALARRCGPKPWEERILQALAEGRFRLWSQEIRGLANGATPGHCAEVLLRLEENGGIVSAAVSVPAAEAHGLMPALDRWVIEAALGWLAERPGASTHLSINLSGQSVAAGRLLDPGVGGGDPPDRPAPGLEDRRRVGRGRGDDRGPARDGRGVRPRLRRRASPAAGRRLRPALLACKSYESPCTAYNRGVGSELPGSGQVPPLRARSGTFRKNGASGSICAGGARESVMTAARQLEDLAAFVARASLEDLSALTRQQLKIRILDSVGCALGALGAEPIRILRRHLADFGGAPTATLIGGGSTAPDRAAFYNSALVRYLDFNDSYVAPGETCHPSDNLGAVLAAAEDAGASGGELLTALALAYQVQCRLSDEAPVRARGFDHTVQGQYAAAAAVARALRLDRAAIANSIAISATAHNALRVTRTGELSHWKGLAYAETCFTATHAAYLARRGITGPPAVFEGNKGFMESIAGEFTIDWSAEDLERVRRTIVKRYNAEIHSQSTLEAVLELRAERRLDPAAVEAVEINTFGVAYHIIGGGEEGDKTVVRRKEEADHSLPYLVAVALLDGQVLPEQFRQERIEAEDVQSLLRRVTVREDPAFSRRFPEAMPCDVRIRLAGGEVLERHKEDYEGFHTRPMPWEAVEEKFHRLAAAGTGHTLRRRIVAAVAGLEELPVTELMDLLARAGSAAGP